MKNYSDKQVMNILRFYLPKYVRSNIKVTLSYPFQRVTTHCKLLVGGSMFGLTTQEDEL